MHPLDGAGRLDPAAVVLVEVERRVQAQLPAHVHRVARRGARLQVALECREERGLVVPGVDRRGRCLVAVAAEALRRVRQPVPDQLLHLRNQRDDATLSTPPTSHLFGCVRISSCTCGTKEMTCS